MELPIAALLRLLITEHRPGVPELLHLAAAGHAMLKDRAHTAGSAFRTQGQRLFVAIEEGVHLLVDHVGAFTDAASEEVGELQDRQANLAIAVAVEQLREGAFQITPGRGLRRQDVVHATNGLQGLAQWDSLKISCAR